MPNPFAWQADIPNREGSWAQQAEAELPNRRHREEIERCISHGLFVSCALSLQAAASRLIYSYGRDQMIIGSRLLAKFDHKRHVPSYALLAAVVVPAALIVGSIVSTHPLTKLISFGTVGVYIGFQMVVLAALRARVKGWDPSGKYRLGRWGMVVMSVP